MKPSLYALAAIAVPFQLTAQECVTGRYTDPTFFPDVTVTTAIPFGNNTSVTGSPQTLRMDIYEPTGDLLDARPVVLVAFGGSFVAGSRADVADICMTFAHMGYVAVACDYRVGFFLPNAATTTRAVMRGMHDMKACVRFLRKTVAEDDNPYRIDPDRIISGGVSAGAISALHATYLDQPSEIPAIMNGEIAALGGVEGNSGSPGYSSAVLGNYSFSGAIADTLYIVPGDPALASIHEVGDGIVPYGTQQVSVIGIPTGLVASGGHDIHERMVNLGIPNCFLSYPGNGHVGYLNSDPVVSLAFVAQFMSELVCDQPVTCGASPTAVTENTKEERALVYPNPTNGPVQMELPDGSIATLFDINGREMFTERSNGGLVQFDLSGLSNGIYSIRLANDHHSPYRVVKVN